MMHILPFGTALSDALVEAIRKMAEHAAVIILISSRTSAAVHPIVENIGS